MKERPILFSAPMVRAILDGSKTQTRRIVKPQSTTSETPYHRPDGLYVYTVCGGHGVGNPFPCPYGQPGDRLWVRETFAPFEHAPGFIYRADADHDGSVPYLDNGAGGLGGGVCHYRPSKWKPSIFCTRAASRITLEITAVRVERLQEIDWIDAKREGVRLEDCEIGPAPHFNIDYVGGYRRLWESINGPDSWDANPFVWVIEFRRL